MSIDQEVEILRRIPLFANIEPSRLKLMAFASERVTYRAGQALFSEGDAGDAAYIIMEGDCEVLVDGDKEQIAVAEVGANDIVGEIAILIDVPRTATVAAKTDVTALRITKDLFLRMMADFPEMGLEVMRVLAHRLEETTGRLRDLQKASRNKGAEEK